MTTIQTSRIALLHGRAIQTLIEILRIRRVLDDYPTRAYCKCVHWPREYINNGTNRWTNCGRIATLAAVTIHELTAGLV